MALWLKLNYTKLSRTCSSIHGTWYSCSPRRKLWIYLPFYIKKIMFNLVPSLGCSFSMQLPLTTRLYPPSVLLVRLKYFSSMFIIFSYVYNYNVITLITVFLYNLYPCVVFVHSFSEYTCCQPWVVCSKLDFFFLKLADPHPFLEFHRHGCISGYRFLV